MPQAEDTGLARWIARDSSTYVTNLSYEGKEKVTGFSSFCDSSFWGRLQQSASTLDRACILMRFILEGNAVERQNRSPRGRREPLSSGAGTKEILLAEAQRARRNSQIAKQPFSHGDTEARRETAKSEKPTSHYSEIQELFSL
jgi:hypothetical protein